jgi:hypothetical protein
LSIDSFFPFFALSPLRVSAIKIARSFSLPCFRVSVINLFSRGAAARAPVRSRCRDRIGNFVRSAFFVPLVFFVVQSRSFLLHA